MVSKKQIKQISKLKLDVALEAMKFTMRSQYQKNDEWLPLIRPPTWLINIETFKSFSQLLVYTSASCLIENTRKRRLQPKHTTRFPWSLLENKPQGIINPPKKKMIYNTKPTHIPSENKTHLQNTNDYNLSLSSGLSRSCEHLQDWKCITQKQLPLCILSLRARYAQCLTSKVFTMMQRYVFFFFEIPL